MISERDTVPRLCICSNKPLFVHHICQQKHGVFQEASGQLSTLFDNPRYRERANSLMESRLNTISYPTVLKWMQLNFLLDANSNRT